MGQDGYLNPNPRLYHDIIWSVSLANPPRYPQVSALTGVVSERYQIHIMGFLYEPMCYGVWPNASTSIVHGTSPKESRASRHTKRELIQTTIYINHVRPCLFNFFFLSFQWFLLVPIAPLGWDLRQSWCDPIAIQEIKVNYAYILGS